MNTLKLPGLGLIISILTLIISSWFLIHLLAIFGVFLSLAYPVWWLFAPKQTVCFFCRAKREGEHCPLCKRQIKKSEGISPLNLRSAILNGTTILLFSIFSIILVFGESKLLFKMGFPPTPKTVSFVIPTKGQHRLGEIFPMKIEITGIKVPINAVQADVGFDPTKLEVVNVLTEDSFANIFIQKEINNEGGYARLTGGLPNPGFFSDKGVFGTVLFKGIAPGVDRVEFLPSSMVLANDGRGTNVLKDLPSVSYLILPEKISKEEEEMQKSIAMSSEVLGESAEGTQMKFYEETKVLGAQVGKEIAESKNPNVFSKLFTVLERFDTFVTDKWYGVYRFAKLCTNIKLPKLR